MPPEISFALTVGTINAMVLWFGAALCERFAASNLRRRAALRAALTLIQFVTAGTLVQIPHPVVVGPLTMWAALGLGTWQFGRLLRGDDEPEISLLRALEGSCVGIVFTYPALFLFHVTVWSF